jgi:hypothetical protein
MEGGEKEGDLAKCVAKGAVSVVKQNISSCPASTRLAMGRFVAEGVEKKSLGGRVDGRGARYSRRRQRRRGAKRGAAARPSDGRGRFRRSKNVQSGVVG